MPRRKPALDSVVIVEDEPLIAMGLEDALRASGAREIHSFTRASDALDALGKITPTLLVMDVELIDSQAGHGVAEVALQIFSPPPHLIFSTGAPERVPARLVCAGHLFAKPYDFSALAAFAAGLGSG